MTHPTGEHSVAAKLMSAYIDVDIKLHEAEERAKGAIKGIESQAESSGLAAKNTIVNHLRSAGAPAAAGFGSTFKTGLHDTMQAFAQGEGRDLANTLQGHIGQAFIDRLGDTEEAGKQHGHALVRGIIAGSASAARADAGPEGGPLGPMTSAMRTELARLEPEMLSRGQRLGVIFGSGLTSALEGASQRLEGASRRGVGFLGEQFGSIGRMGEAAAAKVSGAGEAMSNKLHGSLSSISSATMGLVSGPMAGLFAAVTTVGGALDVLKGGFGRLESLQEFEERMHALGQTTQQTRDVITSLQNAAAGTAFRVPDLLNVGQGASMRGMSGAGLTDYIRTLENVSSVTGSPVDQIDALMSRIKQRGYANQRELASSFGPNMPIENWMKSEGIGTGGDPAKTAKAQETLDHISAQLQAAQEKVLGPKTTEAQRDAHDEQIRHLQQQQTAAQANLTAAQGPNADANFKSFAAGGGVTYQMILDEMNKHTSGAAADMAKGVGPQLHIMGDNINKVGGAVLEPFFGKTGGFLATVNKGLENFATTLEKPEVQAGILHFGESIANGIKNTWNDLKEAGSIIMSGAKNMWSEFQAGLTKSIGGDAASKVGNFFKGLIEKGPSWQDQLKGLMHFFGEVAHWVGAAGHAIDNMNHALANVNHAIDNTVHFFVKLYDAGKSVNEWLTNLPDKFGKMIDHAGGAIINAFTGIGGKITDSISGIFSGIHLPHIPGFASGGMLPGSATIQHPSGPRGLVQWAEPSTGGEAFIPLAGGARSQEIWMETGRRLGMLASYAPGGVRGGRHREPERDKTEHVATRVLDVMDKFADRVDKVHKGFTGITDSLKKLKGGDAQGGLDGLSQTIKDVTPTLRTTASDLKAAKNALPDSMPHPALPAGSTVRDKIRSTRPKDIGDAITRADEIGKHAQDITTGLGGGAIPGLDAITNAASTVDDARNAHGHLQSTIQSLREGHHSEALEHGADLVNVVGSLGHRFLGIDSDWTDPVNEAVAAQWALQGAGKGLGAIGARAAPLLGKAAPWLEKAGAGLAGDIAAPIALGYTGGKYLNDKMLEHNFLGLGSRMEGAYDETGTAKNALDRFVDRTPLLHSLFGAPDSVRYANKKRKEEADAKAKRGWDPADNDMLLDPKHAPPPPKAAPPTQLASAITSGGVGSMNPDDLAALGFAGGGFLPGDSRTDNMLGMLPSGHVFGLAGGEGVIKTEVAQKPWVKALVNMLNKGGLPGYAGGGESVGYGFVDNMVGTPYSQGARNDCSGMASQVINSFLGLPPRSSMFTTRNEGEWLAAHGFTMGEGPPGTLRVGWYNNGSNPNDGHTALTLPDGTPVESGGSHGNFLAGGGAAGADASEFDHHAYLPKSPQGSPVGGIGMGGSSPVSGSGSSSGGGGGVGGSGGTGGSSGGSGGFSPPDLGGLADIGVGGLKENMLPGFSDPTEWGVVKSGAALFKFLGALGKSKGMAGAGGLSLIGDAMSGSGSGMVADMQSLIGGPKDASILAPADMATAGAGLPGFQPPQMPGAPANGGAQGEATTTNNIDQSVSYPNATIHDSGAMSQQHKVKGDRASDQYRHQRRSH